jgi:hypothetical protein
MPVYEYQCISCRTAEVRIGALDDNTAICMDCGDLMLRMDEDIFKPYFEEPTREVTLQKKHKAA